VAGALILGIAGGRLLDRQPEGSTLPPLLFDIPDDTGTMVTGSLALSPNGEHLVFARRDSLGGQDLWIRRLDEDEARPLPGTRGGRYPFWSADGQKIGFFIRDKLYRAGLDGSAVSQIASIREGPMGGAWNQSDVILVGTNDGPIFRVPASGGAVEPVTEVIDSVENNHCWPAFLPDGEHFVFLSDASSDEGHRLYVHSLDGDDRKILQKVIRSAIFVDMDGALLWSDNGQLFARPFDFSRREFTGPRVLVQGGIQPFGENHECALTLSTNGILAFQTGSDEAIVVQIALDGLSRTELLAPDRYRNPRLSPDGTMLAFEVQVSSEERLLWVQDLARGTRTLVSERGKMSDSAAWSADGEMLYYDSSASESGSWHVYRKRVRGGSAPERVGRPEGTDDIAVMDCSDDGKWIVIGANQPNGHMGVFLGSLDGEKPDWSPWLEGSSTYNFARFSPNSRWIAFESGATGQSEVYVSPLEGGPAAQQVTVSVGGGSDAAWSRDGSKVYYRSPTGILMVSAVTESGDRIEFAPPVRLVELQPPRVGYLRNVYDPAPDGTSVIAFIETAGFTPTIRVRTGWRSW
jgi:serine/threonine-protein kinase